MAMKYVRTTIQFDLRAPDWGTPNRLSAAAADT
jgi:hypothetical protein